MLWLRVQALSARVDHGDPGSRVLCADLSTPSSQSGAYIYILFHIVLSRYPMGVLNRQLLQHPRSLYFFSHFCVLEEGTETR